MQAFVVTPFNKLRLSEGLANFEFMDVCRKHAVASSDLSTFFACYIVQRLVFKEP